MMSLLVILAMAVAEPAPAAAAPAPNAPTTVTPADVDGVTYGVVIGKNVPKGEKVCFKDAVSGSKLPVRRCMNRAEFEDRQRQERQYIEQIQRDARAPISN